ncbi:MAG: CoA pyrophosphatase [Marivibrio sp.]|uniref:CoA pyrophosphatase n=1 Tax=Marivibrio sp. TaxID=2039719 RepID=UPI0032EEC790
MSEGALSPERIVARLRAAAEARDAAVDEEAPRRGDDDLNPGMTPTRATLTPAAVLVPIVLHRAGPTVLLTRRTDHLRDHAGQVSFPGGRIDPHDRDAVDAALREAEEEVGVARERVEVIAPLDPYITRTGFRVTPVVGFLTPPIDPKPDPFEVADVFETPLSFLLDRRNHQRHSREYEGRTRYFYAMPYGSYYIWGATAGMLVNLADVLMRDGSRP